MTISAMPTSAATVSLPNAASERRALFRGRVSDASMDAPPAHIHVPISQRSLQRATPGARSWDGQSLADRLSQSHGNRSRSGRELWAGGYATIRSGSEPPASTSRSPRRSRQIHAPFHTIHELEAPAHRLIVRPPRLRLDVHL